MEVADVCIHIYLLEESDIKNIPANDNNFREFIHILVLNHFIRLIWCKTLNINTARKIIYQVE